MNNETIREYLEKHVVNSKSPESVTSKAGGVNIYAHKYGISNPSSYYDKYLKSGVTFTTVIPIIKELLIRYPEEIVENYMGFRKFFVEETGVIIKGSYVNADRLVAINKDLEESGLDYSSFDNLLEISSFEDRYKLWDLVMYYNGISLGRLFQIKEIADWDPETPTSELLKKTNYYFPPTQGEIFTNRGIQIDSIFNKYGIGRPQYYRPGDLNTAAFESFIYDVFCKMSDDRGEQLALIGEFLIGTVRFTGMTLSKGKSKHYKTSLSDVVNYESLQLGSRSYKLMPGEGNYKDLAKFMERSYNPELGKLLNEAIDLLPKWDELKPVVREETSVDKVEVPKADIVSEYSSRRSFTSVESFIEVFNKTTGAHVRVPNALGGSVRFRKIHMHNITSLIRDFCSVLERPLIDSTINRFFKALENETSLTISISPNASEGAEFETWNRFVKRLKEERLGRTDSVRAMATRPWISTDQLHDPIGNRGNFIDILREVYKTHFNMIINEVYFEKGNPKSVSRKDNSDIRPETKTTIFTNVPKEEEAEDVISNGPIQVINNKRMIEVDFVEEILLRNNTSPEKAAFELAMYLLKNK